MQQRHALSYRHALLPILAATLGAMGGGSTPDVEERANASPSPRRPRVAELRGLRYSHATTWRTWSHATLSDALASSGDVRDVKAAIAKRQRKAQRRLGTIAGSHRSTT
jgi:hypothetical protein